MKETDAGSLHKHPERGSASLDTGRRIFALDP